jgi:diguanylate cyclase (GGDEF)-like protein/PAS domain S-box-containing protein
MVVVAVHVMVADQPIAQWTYLAGVCGAAVAAGIGVRRSRSGRLGLLVAVGVGLSALGDFAWQAYVWTRGFEPDVSVADVAYLSSYLAIGAALLLLVVRGDGRRRLDLDGVVDVAAISVIALLVQWDLTLSDIVGDSSVGTMPKLVWALYPALDAVLLGLVVRAGVTRRLRGPAGGLIAAGAICWLLSDFGFTLPAASGGLSTWLDAGWIMGAVLLAAASWQPPRPPITAGDDRPDRVAYGSIVIALVPLLVPGVLEVVGAYSDDHPDPLPLFVASVVLVGVAFVRTARSLRGEARARAHVRSQQRYAHAIARNSSDAVAVFDADGRIVDDAPQLAELVGHHGAATRGVDPGEVLVPDDIDVWRAMFRRGLRNPGHTFESELRVGRTDGDEQWLHVRLVNLLDDPDVNGVVANLHDITDRKRAEAELAHQAFHDGLTGLANRALFTDRVEQALRRNHRDGAESAVIFLDLDAFKTVNDTLGHGPGDDLLREVASRISVAVRSGDTVARLGGDEFAILLEQTSGVLEEARAVADRILVELERPVGLGHQSVTISASLGIAVSDREATSASLLRDADVAMYKAKATGKGQRVVYDPGMRLDAMERLQLEADLTGVLERGELRLVYQPVIELETEHVSGFEALLRWEHPTLGNIPPDRFVPLAEDSGAILPIGRWVLAEACRTAARWHREYPEVGEPLTMAVNLSGRQLSKAGFIDDVKDALTDSGLAPTSLVLEVTETALVVDTAGAARRLAELRELGVRVAIDDFGTGYSSLSYLRQFPVDILKIDRSFVSCITESSEVPAILRGLLDLGRTLQLSMVAEGVESGVQRDSLRGEHCAMAQGFLFARPLEVDDAELLVLGRATDRNPADAG